MHVRLQYLHREFDFFDHMPQVPRVGERVRTNVLHKARGWGWDEDQCEFVVQEVTYQYEEVPLVPSKKWVATLEVKPVRMKVSK
jgi:hypothetical protein